MKITDYWLLIEKAKCVPPSLRIEFLSKKIESMSKEACVWFDVISAEYLRHLMLARIPIALECIYPEEVTDSFLIDFCGNIILNGRCSYANIITNIDFLTTLDLEVLSQEYGSSFLI